MLFRSILGSLASCFNLACTFTIVMSFNYMRQPTALDEYGTFWFYMSFCIAGLFYVYFLLPETKGKSFEEIEQIFASKKKNLARESVDVNVNPIFTIDAGSVDKLPQRQGGMNEGYHSESGDEEDQGQIVPTPL